MKLEGTSVAHLVQLPAQPGSLRADCLGPYLGSFWSSTGRKLHNLSGQPVPLLHSQHTEKGIPCHSEAILYMPRCMYCLLSWHWASLEKDWFFPLCIFSLGNVYRCSWDSSELSLLWSNKCQFSAFPPRRNDSIS